MAEDKKDDHKAKAKAIKDSKKKDDADVSARNQQMAAKNDQDYEEAEQEPAVDPRKFVIINPAIDDIVMKESRSVSQIDYLIRLGLGDQDHLSYYRQVLAAPKKAINSPYLRKYVAEVTEELLDIVFSDSQMYNRLRTILQEKFKKADKDNKERKGSITEIADPNRSYQLIKKAMGKRNV